MDDVDEKPDLTLLTERHLTGLRAHCYRMLGSRQEAEELAQEALLKAWRHRDALRSSDASRAWLYRIATHACLDHLRRRRRRPQPYDQVVGGPAGGLMSVPWLEPFPHANPHTPEDDLVSREALGLGFLVTVQHLPPRQRAAFLAFEVLDASLTEVADLLDVSVPAVKSLLQRARATLASVAPDPATVAEPSDDEEAVVARYIRAHEQADIEAMEAVLTEDVTMTMPPLPLCFVGRESVLALTREVFDTTSPHWHGRWRSLPVRSNGQPAVAHYCEHSSAEATKGMTGAFVAQVLDVLLIDGDRVSRVTGFSPDHFAAFGLPLTLEGS